MMSRMCLENKLPLANKVGEKQFWLKNMLIDVLKYQYVTSILCQQLMSIQYVLPIWRCRWKHECTMHNNSLNNLLLPWH